MPDSKSRKQSMPRIVLHEFGAEDERPEMAVYALDANDNVLSIARVDDDGAFNLSNKVIGEARFMILGPVAESLDDVPQEVTRRFYAEEFLNKDLITVVKPDWGRWVNIFRCISGDVRHCYIGPVLINELVQFAEIDSVRGLTATAVGRRVAESVLGHIRPFPGGIRFPFKCNPVCVGKIEVYERLCCRAPWDIFDPRIPDIIDDLRVVVDRPDPPFPPDPGPYSQKQYIKSGALDLKSINARRDLAVLETLDHAQQLEYVEARPYLWPRWECGSGVKKGEGTINPDGSFTICWTEYPIIIDFCYKEYAFKVTQEIEGIETVVYDGRAVNAWFSASEDINITIFGREVRACRKPPVDADRPFAILEKIGITDSWRLQTPPPTGPRSVGPMAADSGLLDASSNPYLPAAPASSRDINWGGTLEFLYYFSDGLKALGAKYYRVSYQRAQSNGTPVAGDPDYFEEGLYWKRWIALGKTETVLLGPVTRGSEEKLYEIPYGVEWKANQFHASINTDTVETFKGRYLVTLELFDNAGNRLKPDDAVPHADFLATDAPFDFLRWEDPADGVIPPHVHHPALTNLFWWDNTRAKGRIVDLRLNGVTNIGECQYLCAEQDSDTLTIGYRAYFPGNALFLKNHTLCWDRGVSAAEGSFVTAGPGNIGEEPPIGSAVGVTGPVSFATLLGGYQRCSFAATLRVYVKTFNGRSRVNDYDVEETDAFALQVGNCGP